MAIRPCRKRAIYVIIKKVKAGKSTANMSHLNQQKTFRTPDLISSAIKEDSHLSMETIAAAQGVSEKNHLNHFY
jgi:hypothetical protein